MNAILAFVRLLHKISENNNDNGESNKDRICLKVCLFKTKVKKKTHTHKTYTHFKRISDTNLENE